MHWTSAAQQYARPCAQGLNHTHMSVSWFIRNFKKYTGSTPMQFIVGIRINNAQMLLETTTYSINEISKIVGYDNQLYFSRLFHKLKGYSPREYRKIRNKF